MDTTLVFFGYNAAHGCHDHAQENPLEGEHEDDAMFPPLWALPAFVEEKADSNTSVFLCPHNGQLASSLSLLLMHKYSKTLPHFLHLNS